MNSMFGIKQIQIRVFECAHDDVQPVNDFLTKHDGDIIDVRTDNMLYGVTKYIVIYKAAED